MTTCDKVPEISPIEASAIVAGLNRVECYQVLNASIKWLMSPVSGVQIYEGIVGRPYSDIERARIEMERGLILQESCPFALEGGNCVLGLHMPLECQGRDFQNPTAEVGFLPTLLAAAIDREEVRSLVAHRKVPDAKIAKQFKAPATTKE
jgi:hypothetical protein